MMSRDARRATAGAARWALLWLPTLTILCVAGSQGQEHRSAPRSLAANPGERWIGLTFPSKTVLVAPPRSGLLAECLVDEGDFVEKGVVLARLDSRLQELRTRRLDMIASADLAVRKAKERLGFARKEEVRVKRLAADEVVKRSLVEKVEFNRVEAEIQLDEAKLDREKARLAWEESKVLLDERTLRSPIAGFVTAKLKEEGEAVEELESVIEIVTLDPLFVDFHCPLADEGSFRAGSRITVRRVARPDEPRVGTVLFSSRVADASSNTVKVRLRIENPDSTWKAGLKVALTPVQGPASPPGK